MDYNWDILLVCVVTISLAGPVRHKLSAGLVEATCRDTQSPQVRYLRRSRMTRRVCVFAIENTWNNKRRGGTEELTYNLETLTCQVGRNYEHVFVQHLQRFDQQLALQGVKLFNHLPVCHRPYQLPNPCAQSSAARQFGSRTPNFQRVP